MKFVVYWFNNNKW